MILNNGITMCKLYSLTSFLDNFSIASNITEHTYTYFKTSPRGAIHKLLNAKIAILTPPLPLM